MAIARSAAAKWSLSAVAVGVLLAGCSASVSAGKTGPELSSDELAASLADKLASTTGRPKPDITCPEDLAGKVGAETRCTLTADDGSTLGVSATVTSVDGEQIHYDFEADETASPAPN
ncbi:DUF4333 domain-containing protein [Streptomyces atroolivaceus]|uniref:DUF4333 domain-containing protein n=1 Tax=Streptomyces atroolivaceus TaxID=66869 RepID=UPI0036504A24